MLKKTSIFILLLFFATPSIACNNEYDYEHTIATEIETTEENTSANYIEPVILITPSVKPERTDTGIMDNAYHYTELDSILRQIEKETRTNQ